MLLEKVIKWKYARRLICNLNQLVVKKETKQWIDYEYLTNNTKQYLPQIYEYTIIFL